MEWADETLKWNSSVYGVAHVLFKKDEIWSPDIMVYNRYIQFKFLNITIYSRLYEDKRLPTNAAYIKVRIWLIFLAVYFYALADFRRQNIIYIDF